MYDLYYDGPTRQKLGRRSVTIFLKRRKYTITSRYVRFGLCFAILHPYLGKGYRWMDDSTTCLFLYRLVCVCVCVHTFPSPFLLFILLPTTTVVAMYAHERLQQQQQQEQQEQQQCHSIHMSTVPSTRPHLYSCQSALSSAGAWTVPSHEST